MGASTPTLSYNYPPMLSATAISHRTGRPADRPTATGPRTALPRPGPRTAAGGRSATAADPARAQPAGGRS